MIGIVNKMQRERSFNMVPFIKNELLMLGLIKPTAVALTADHLEELSTAMLLAENLRARGNSCADRGDCSAAEDSYCKALEQWPTFIDAAADLLEVLRQQNKRQDALNLIVKFLPIAAHKRSFVLAAADALAGYGATVQAAGVCDEYIMSNPHDVEVKTVREKLICQ
jgi:tetratricopeptide (TPR) repeat protein